MNMVLPGVLNEALVPAVERGEEAHNRPACGLAMGFV